MEINLKIMITLRQNQEEPIRKAIAYFNEKKPKPSLIVLPTAWGKSVLTAFVAKNTEDKLLVLQPTKELLEQNYSKYMNLCDGYANAGIYSASFGRKDVAQITYATIGSIKNLGATFRELGFKKLLIDEAHLYPREASSMLGKFLEDSGISHVLGITATPIKLQQYTSRGGDRYSKLVMLTSRSKKGNFYKDIIHVGQVQEMVEMGFWSRLYYRAGDFDEGLLVFNSTKAEFTDESVQKAHERNGGMMSVTQALDSVPERKHILVFVPSVQEAVNLSKIYPSSGVVHGEMPKSERDSAIARFRSGELRVIFNVRVLSTGFDYTGIDCIILGISTASIALYYQIIGRATRIDQSKKDALIIDLGGNVKRFGKVEDIRFEEGRMWRMFGTDNVLLSGVPIHEIGMYTKADTEKIDNPPMVEIMPFGKYKDHKISDVPASYRRWMLETFTWKSSQKTLQEAIIKSLQKS